MSSLFNTLWRSAILDDGAYHDWRDRPNIFLRGILLILIITLVAELVPFVVNLYNQVNVLDAQAIREQIRESMDLQYQFNPVYQDPEVREMAEESIDSVIGMVTDIMAIRAPLPRGVSGFLTALGGWLTRAAGAIGGWLLYGALVLVTANLLGGGATLRDFYGMSALYVVPGLLAILQPVTCVGPLLALVGTIWSIVVYIKSTQMVAGLDLGRATVAALAPAVVLALAGLLLGLLAMLWLIILL
ncbi:MAG: hypothetical protein ACK2UY_16085 [Anaerolineae bacterium]